MNDNTATIDLRLFASLNNFTPPNASCYPIASGMTIAELLQNVHVPLNEAKLIFINGIRSHPDAKLNGGERVGIFPPVGGG